MLATILAIAGAVLIAASAIVGWYAWNNMTYADRDAKAVRNAGFVERHITLGSGATLVYSEGPLAGPAVVLLHGQGSARQTYDRALPELAKSFQVFALDVAGHGLSDRTPDRYTVNQIGADVVDFISSVVGEPVILSGHSSGGLIAAWVATEAPDLVSAVLFEDAPFFSTEANRYGTQFNYLDLAVPAHAFLAQDVEADFASWYITHNAWIGYFGRGRDGIVRYARKRRAAHPAEPLRLWFMPPVTNESYAHMDRFDPEFADAFYYRRWQANFHQADVLRRVTQPAVLVHANWRITDEGILEGAMTDNDAARACDLLSSGRIERVNTGHGFHFENPRAFAELFSELTARVSAPQTPPSC